MGRYNTLVVAMTCPFCGHAGPTEIDIWFGALGRVVYHLGDRCAWAPDRPVASGGRPPGGDLDGQGYVACEGCGRDWFAIVEVRDDRFAGARPDPVISEYSEG